MLIGRKQALVGFVAGILGALPWSKRAVAAPPLPVQPPTPVALPVDAATIIDDLRKRIAALEAARANQVAFTKDANGNLSLASAGSVTVQAGSALTLKAGGLGTLASAGAMKISGATVNLN